MSDVVVGAHRILIGDVRERLAGLEDRSYQCVVTSPPYWGLRDYGVDGQIGLEPSVDGFVAAMVEVFRGVRRVLRDDGVLWLNMGDCYAGSWGAQSRGAHDESSSLEGSSMLDARRIAAHPHGINTGSAKRTPGLKPKDLIGVPWMVAMALRAEGWFLRAALPWVKRSAMPDSTRDRPGTAGVETVFMLTKRRRYFYDDVAARRTATSTGGACFGKQEADASGTMAQSRKAEASERNCAEGQRNFRCSDLFYDTFPRAMGLIVDGEGFPLALDVNPRGFREAHFATFPPELVEPLIRASVSERGRCAACGSPWVRVTEKRTEMRSGSGRAGHAPNGKHGGAEQALSGDYDVRMGPVTFEETVDWEASCNCQGESTGPDIEVAPCRVLDPFAGSGTVGVVCEALGCVFDGIELNREYAAMAERRIRGAMAQAGLFALSQ